jgi:hypothetical protein
LAAGRNRAHGENSVLECPSLSDQPISREQEEKLRNLAKDLFLNDYPNPERKGCPDSETIKAIALGRIAGEEASRWRVHAAACSPCTREYVDFRKEAAREKRIRRAGLIAAAAVLIVVVGWAAVKKFAANPAEVSVIAWAEGWRSSHLDLRGYEALRGAEFGSPLPPLVLPRGKLALTIDLPVGSEPGRYEVELQQPSRQNVVRADGTASLADGLTILKIRIDTRGLRSGSASLWVHPPQRSWSRYPVSLR